MHLTWPFGSNKLRKHLVMMVLSQLIEWFVISEVYSFDPTTTYSYYDFSVMTRLLFKFQNFFFLYFWPIGNKINQLFSFFAFMKLKSALFHFSHVYFSYWREIARVVLKKFLLHWTNKAILFIFQKRNKCTIRWLRSCLFYSFS